MNSIVYFKIQSSNIEREVNFYRSVFGWSITKGASMPISYYRIETDGIQGAILERPAPVSPMSGRNAFTCSMEVENFDKTAELILSQGAARLPCLNSLFPADVGRVIFLIPTKMSLASSRSMKMPNRDYNSNYFIPVCK
jgi:predicted enzyme related to lactoylglutathione lyase